MMMTMMMMMMIMMMIPMDVTLLGMVTDGRDVHSWKVPIPDDSDYVVIIIMIIMVVHRYRHHKL